MSGNILLLLATLLACASRTTAVTTQQLSATVGGETNITCLFGEGTLRNIYWYFNTTQRILTLAKGVLTVAPPYKGRATLQNDNNTLSLKGITIADEGTYRCDVDRQGQPAVLHIYSDLNIYSLRPGTLPVVSPCAMVGEATHCTAQANDTFTITCTLFNVYPVKDAVLTWYQDGKSVSSSYGESLNNDVIANLSLRIEVTQSRNLSCNATFESADGRQHTAVSVEALVTPLADDPDTPEGKIGMPAIIGTVLGLMVFIGLLVMSLIWYLAKRRKWHCPLFCTQYSKVSKKGEGNPNSDSETNLGSSNDEAKSVSTTTNNTLRAMAGSADKDNHANIQVPECKLQLLADEFPHANYEALCRELGRKYNKSENKLVQHNNDYAKAVMGALMEWKNATGGYKVELQQILKDSKVGGLANIIE